MSVSPSCSLGCTCRNHPVHPSMRVREALEAYLAENGFTVAAYRDAWTRASFFGLPFWVPNTARHRWAIMLHDLHHVATGFGTDLPGEGEISAWEARRAGMRALGLYVGGIVLGGAIFGMVISPRRTLAAYRAAPSPMSSLFGAEASYESLLDLTVGELRARLDLPAHGLAEGTRRLHPDAPKAPARVVAAA